MINVQSKAILPLPVRVSFSDFMAYQGTVISLFLKFVFKNVWLHPTACGILVPGPGIKPKSLALEGEILTTGPPGKPQGSQLRKKAFFTLSYDLFPFSFHLCSKNLSTGGIPNNFKKFILSKYSCMPK